MTFHCAFVFPALSTVLCFHIFAVLDMHSLAITHDFLTCEKWSWQPECRPLCRLWCITSRIWWSAVSLQSQTCREGKLLSGPSLTRINNKDGDGVYIYINRYRYIDIYSIYWFDHSKPVLWALHCSQGSCQSFGSIFVCLVPGGGVVSSSLECLLWVTYVDLPILHSLAPVAMATRTVNAVTTRERLRIIHGNGHTRVNPVCACVCVCSCVCVRSCVCVCSCVWLLCRCVSHLWLFL